VRALIVEDQGMFRDLLAKVLESDFGYENIMAVGTGAEALDALTKESFDLLILDIDLPDTDGFAIAEKACRLEDPPLILGMSAYCDEYMVHRIMESSMNGFIDKSEQSVETLRAAIDTVCGGNYYFTEPVMRVRRALREDPRAFPKYLTPRECQALTLIGSGMSDEQVAEAFGVTVATAKWHRKQIMRKLGMHTSRELMVFAVQKGFVRRTGGNAVYPVS